MKRIFLKFRQATNTRIAINAREDNTSGDASFNVPPMGANPPTRKIFV